MSNPMRLNCLALLLLLLIKSPLFADGLDLLPKQPDGSVLIDPRNGWAIARGICPNFDAIGMTDDTVVRRIWQNETEGISDNFALHAALEKYGEALDDATARAKTITNVTYVFGVGIRDYDFSSKAFPFGPIWNTGGRHMEPLTFVSFDQFLAKQADVPDENNARILQDVINKYRHALVAVVHGTLKGAVQLKTSANLSDPTKPESEYTSGAFYRIIISPTSVDYRLGDAKGPTLFTQTFGASPSLSPVVIPPVPKPTP